MSQVHLCEHDDSFSPSDAKMTKPRGNMWLLKFYNVNQGLNKVDMLPQITKRQTLICPCSLYNQFSILIN